MLRSSTRLAVQTTSSRRSQEWCRVFRFLCPNVVGSGATGVQRLGRPISIQKRLKVTAASGPDAVQLHPSSANVDVDVEVASAVAESSSSSARLLKAAPKANARIVATKASCEPVDRKEEGKLGGDAAAAAIGEGEDTLPYLPRPLGVSEPPSTERKTWKEETLALMDQDVRMARRKHLVKEASKGYYSDLNATRKNGGKTWIAPHTLIREDHALYFPDIMGSSLVNKDEVHTADLCRGKISVIGMLSTVISEEHINSFVKETNDLFLTDPNYRFVQINLQENVAKAFLVSLYRSSLRRSIPQELHATYLLSKQNMEYVREPLGMNNKHIGFVYLLDEQMRVRWAGGGMAIPEESTSLRKCTQVLLGRIKKGGK